jgi:hypothetical protein
MLKGIFRYKQNQPVTWFHKQPAKSNQYCLYCGIFVGDGASAISNKEHLIAREFVPSGSLDGGKSFNFIFRACEQCNSEKSNIERHLSSVTMFNSPARIESGEINSLAVRKASKDYHPNKQGVLVQDAHEKLKLTFDGNPNFKMSFDLVSPPQADIGYIRMLAFRHIQGFFSLLTTENPLEISQTRLLPSHHFYFFGAFHSADWGNPQVITATERASEWPCRANIEAANGFFKVIMRRREDRFAEWFWALEWNKSYRVFGGIFHPDQIPKAYSDLPPHNWREYGAHGETGIRSRREISIKVDQDFLFRAK